MMTLFTVACSEEGDEAMSAGTRRRGGEKEWVLPSQAVARNVRAYRLINRMTQADLAEIMDRFGLGWSAGTVGFVERGQRAVTVDEYVGITLCFGLVVGDLFDPTGPLGTDDVSLDLPGAQGDGFREILPPRAHNWARGVIRIREVGDSEYGIRRVRPEEGHGG
jgi:transcriptional regulator with XRE-family HTH domain